MFISLASIIFLLAIEVAFFSFLVSEVLFLISCLRSLGILVFEDLEAVVFMGTCLLQMS